ncbi:hypothetical protein P7C73_g1516, partial [Tremellales sp. Uapishka_1]
MHEFDSSHSSPQLPQAPPWTPYTQYPAGSVVWFAGGFWRAEIAHTSGGHQGSEPSANFHLWTPVPPPSQSFSPYYHQQAQPPPYGYYQASPYLPSSQAPAPSYYHSPGPPFPAAATSSSSSVGNSNILSPVPLPMPSKPPSPSSLVDEKRPSSDETVRDDARSRGILSGLHDGMRYATMLEESRKADDEHELKHELKGKRVCRVGGIGIWCLSGGDQEAEERKKKVWREFGGRHGRAEWVEAAKARTEFYNKESKGVKPLLMWKLVERGQRLPEDVLPIGHEADGAVLYAARAWWEGGVHLGKAAQHNASLSFGGQEHLIDTYEVLCGPLNQGVIRWMNFHHGSNARVEGWQPVEGGRESDGTALLVAKGDYENGVHPGKCLINDDHACVGWGGGELWVRPFQVLAYATSQHR